MKIHVYIFTLIFCFSCKNNTYLTSNLIINEELNIELQNFLLEINTKSQTKNVTIDISKTSSGYYVLMYNEKPLNTYDCNHYEQFNDFKIYITAKKNTSTIFCSDESVCIVSKSILDIQKKLDNTIVGQDFFFDKTGRLVLSSTSNNEFDSDL